MKSIFFTTIVIVGLVFAACKQEKNKTEQIEKETTVEVKKPETTKTFQKKSLNQYMVGIWETSYIKIEYPTYQKSDTSHVFEDDFSKPNTGRAQSEYKKDGTFMAWFKQPNGSKVGETGGNWKTKGDSLYVDYTYLGKQVQTWYIITQTKEGFTGKVIYDWDDDKEFDDILLMKSKKLK